MQQMDKKHLDRFLAEFDFCRNNRAKLGINDAQRTANPLKGIEGSGRLMVVPLQNANIMDREFERAMHGARVRVVIELTTGDRLPLDQPLMAWNMFGKIVKSDELSACASAPCSTKLPVGAQVSRIEVSSEPSLAVQGIYWSSERDPLENAAPPATTGASAAPKLQTACHMSARTNWDYIRFERSRV